MTPSGGLPPSSLEPDVLQAMEAAVAAHRQERLETAIAGYRQVLRLQPALPEAHNNLGQALRSIGRPGEAVASYRVALQARPNYAAAHHNLAVVLAELGDRTASLRHALEAQGLEPANPQYRRQLATLLRGVRFEQASPPIVQAVEACFADPDIDHQILVQAAYSLLRLRPCFRRAVDFIKAGRSEDLAEALRRGELAELLEDSLLQAVLTKALLANPLLERLFTALRRQCLAAATGDKAVPPGLLHGDQAFAVALARQCFLTEYAYAESEEESALISRLGASLDAGEPDWPLLIAFAMYRPLHELPDAARLAEGRPGLPGPIAALLHQQIGEPFAERSIAASLPRLTPVADAVSAGVRQHYEENPYPRWRFTHGQEAQPLVQAVGDLFPHAALGPGRPGGTRALVAGCGTGKHAIDVARRYSDIEVLAVDLSLTSMAYGQRKAGEAGLGNIRFAQADIMALDSLDDRFDLIEALGVLFLLSDPLAGWRKLSALLAPGGLMKVGLYSVHARQAMIAARELLRRRGFTADASGLRVARQTIMALQPGELARKVVGELDFYSLSGFRDLVLCEYDRNYTLPKIAEMLDKLNLEFLGFEFNDDKPRRAYARRFPQDKTLTDLALWDAFEAVEPSTFGTMYQFWCRMKAG